MSSRERLLALGIALLVVVIAGYQFVLLPVLGAFDRVADETTQLRNEVKEARTLVDNQERIETTWAGYRKAGLDNDEYAARARVQASITEWCQTSRLKIDRLETGRDARADEENRFAEITFRLTASGGIRSLQRFFELVSTAPFPLRVVDCTISNPRAGEEGLSLVLNLSTIIDADNATDASGGA